jgi:hypothetical protein
MYEWDTFWKIGDVEIEDDGGAVQFFYEVDPEGNPVIGGASSGYDCDFSLSPVARWGVFNV